MTKPAELGQGEASSSNGHLPHKKEVKRRRRLEDLSFSSPGPAFVGTPTDSEAGDEDSDADQPRRRPARSFGIPRVPSLSHKADEIGAGGATAPQVQRPTPRPSDLAKPPPLFRNFHAKTSTSIRSPNSSATNGAEIKPGRPPHSKARSDGRIEPGSTSNGHQKKSKLSEAASAEGVRKSSSPAKLLTSSSPPKRPYIRKAGKQSAERIPSLPLPPRLPSVLSPVEEPPLVGTPRDRLLASKKQQLDSVYKEHDALVRELFHLTKFVTYFGFDPDVAAQDRSDVFERFRMDYDLPTRLSGATGRATRRIVSAKRGDLDLEAAKKKEAARLTRVEADEAARSSSGKHGKARDQSSLKTKRPKIGHERDRPTRSSSEDSGAESRRSIIIPAKRGRKKKSERQASTQSDNSIESVQEPPKKRPVGRPRKKEPSPEYVPRPPVVLERIEGLPRMRVLQPLHLPLAPKCGGSLSTYLRSWHTTGDYLGGGAGEMEIVPYETLLARERRDAWFYDAIENARAQGLLQDRDEAVRKSQQNRMAEAPRGQTCWDKVLQEMALESSRSKMELRNKIAISKRVARMVILYWDEKLGRGERQKKVEERRIRGLAKYTVREIRKQWKLAVNVVKARRANRDREEKERVGRAQLQSILEQSSQMLGKQHRALVQNEQESEDSDEDEESVTESETGESEVDSFSDEPSSEVADSDDSMGELDAPAEATVEDEAKAKEGEEQDGDLAEEEGETMVSEVISSEDMAARGEEDRAIDEVAKGEEDISKKEGLSSPKIKPPFLLRGQLRPYQQVGFEWLAGLYNNGSNGILADEMGLGKTIQTISVLAHLACDKGEWGPHLVVAPTSVMLNWEVEFKKFLPGFKILSYYGSQKERKEKRRGWNSDNHFNVCITSYQLVLADQHILRRKAWQYLILDEAHHIKNFKSQRWQTLLGFNSKRRLLLTGTPLQNNLMDLWSLMYFLMPNGLTNADGVVSSGFASMKEFQQWFSNPLGKAVENAGMEGEDGEVDDETRGMVSKLHTLLRPYLLRRLKSEVEKELPNKYEHVIKCRLSKRQKFLYNDFMSRAKTRESLASGNYLSIINCLMQLRKVCNHPDLFEQRPIVTSFARSKSVVADYEIKELLVRRELLHRRDDDAVNMQAINLHFNVPDRQHLTPIITRSLRKLDATDYLPQGPALEPVPVDTWTIEGYRKSMSQRSLAAKAAQWKHLRYTNHLQCQAEPPVLFDCDTVRLLESAAQRRHLLPQSIAEKHPADYLSRCDSISRAVLGPDDRRRSMQDIIDRYAFVTPRAVTNDISRWALPGLDYSSMPKEMLSPDFDMLHQPAVKLQIAFPDASLLQYDCGKLQELAVLMQKCKQGGHRILIFTQMTKILDILEMWLSYNGFNYMRLDGSTKVEDRQALTERFNRDERIKAFILSTRSGGLGINLTGADMVLFWDLDWNFQIEAQCMDRAHRIGQTRDVHIYRFVSEHTIEENMLKKSNEKRMLDNMVIQNGQFTTEGLSKMSWIESMFDEGGQTIAGVQVGSSREAEVLPDDRRIENAMDQAEDEEDANAARTARKELHLIDDDFEQEMNQGGATGSAVQHVDQATQDGIASQNGGQAPAVTEVVGGDEGGDEEEEEEEEGGTVDDYMLRRVDAEWDYFVNL